MGITSKNIRFYEDQGLVNPERADNGYREYHKEDVECLKQIKLLRKIGVPIEDIKLLLSGKKQLEKCLSDNISLIDSQQTNLNNRRKLTEQMMDKCSTLEAVDCDYWLDEIEAMEKEGIDFVDLNKIDIHMKKKAGAIIAGVTVIVYMLCMFAILVWAKVNEPDMPMLLTLFIAAVCLVVCVGIGVAIRGRIKEIDGGEEDEASKY